MDTISFGVGLFSVLGISTSFDGEWQSGKRFNLRNFFLGSFLSPGPTGLLHCPVAFQHNTYHSMFFITQRNLTTDRPQPCSELHMVQLITRTLEATNHALSMVSFLSPSVLSLFEFQRFNQDPACSRRLNS